MKSFMCVLLLGALVAGEPPSYRQTRFREESVEVKDAPYPAAGFQPRRKFDLPSRQQFTPANPQPSQQQFTPSNSPQLTRQEFAPPSPPSTSYGTPDNSYSVPFNVYTAPQNQYGAPTTASKSGENDKENDDSLTVEAIAKVSDAKKEKQETKDKKDNQDGAKSDAEIVSNKGAYYVLLPGSQLQRVQFTTENDVNRMAYTARLQYRDEDRAPVYFYTTAPQARVQQYSYQVNSAYVLPPASQNQQIQAYPLPEAPQNQLGLSYAVLPPRQNQYALPIMSQNQQSPAYSVASVAPNQFGSIYAVPSATLQNQYALPILSENQPGLAYSVASVNVPAVQQNRQRQNDDANTPQNQQGSEYDESSVQKQRPDDDDDDASPVEKNHLASAYASVTKTSQNRYNSAPSVQLQTNPAVASMVQVQPESQYGVPQGSKLQSNGRYRSW